MATEHFQQMLLGQMSAEDRLAFEQTITYLAEVANRPNGASAEGSVAGIINRQSPAVRNALYAVSETMDTPRTRPFQEKWDERQNAQEMGFDDPGAAVAVKSAIDGHEVMAGLQHRMGTDADLPSNEPLTMREQVAAAVDYHDT